MRKSFIWLKFRYRFEYVVFLLTALVIRSLPLETASQWSGAGWRLVAPRLHRHRRAIGNLALAFPDKTATEIEQIALGMWENLGRTFAEFFLIDRIINSDRIQFEAPERFELLRDRVKGSIVCSLHLGNWEILSQAAIRIGWSPAGVYRKMTNPLVNRFVNEVRTPLYPGGLIEKSPSAARLLLRHARDGGCIAFLADHREAQGVIATFFGRPASSPSFPAKVAHVLDKPLYVCRVKRLEGVRFSISVAEIAVPRTGDQAADVLVATESIQSAFEFMIRELPDQWMWGHRRWD
jgi:Kdo2-lipid IVA lauroyltransferase/acyltransferase